MEQVKTGRDHHALLVFLEVIQAYSAFSVVISGGVIQFREAVNLIVCETLRLPIYFLHHISVPKIINYVKNECYNHDNSE